MIRFAWTVIFLVYTILMLPAGGPVGAVIVGTIGATGRIAMMDGDEWTWVWKRRHRLFGVVIVEIAFVVAVVTYLFETGRTQLGLELTILAAWPAAMIITLLLLTPAARYHKQRRRGLVDE